mgnify:CR=1 FL=1
MSLACLVGCACYMPPFAQTAHTHRGVVRRGGAEGPAPPAPELEPVVKELPPELLARLAGLEGQGLDSAEARTEAGALFSAAAAYPEGVDLLKDELRKLSRGKSDAVTTRRILGWVAWRHGDLKDAAREFKRLAKDEGDLDSRLAYAQLLDARGEAEDALNLNFLPKTLYFYWREITISSSG